MPFGVLYCEQGSINQLFEPLNSLSNMFFVLSAILLFLYFQKKKITDSKSKLFIGLISAIGFGSLIWHIVPTEVTFFLDVIPIALFLIIYLFFLLEKIVKQRRMASLIMGVYLLVVVLGFIIFPVPFSSYGGIYIATLLFLSGTVVAARLKNVLFKQASMIFVLFLVAFITRQLDLILCSLFPFGTHFVWHMINAFIVYYGVKALYD